MSPPASSTNFGAAMNAAATAANSLVRAVWRAWLTLRYQILDRRYGRLVLETIDGVPIIVLPEVFNPVLLRSGAFMVQALDRQAVEEEMKVLDLGCGSGVGAVFAARRGARVTAVDINPEAVRCTLLNALLNRLEGRIEVRQGDLFEPLPGERFDLILFNPPFYRGRPGSPLDHAWRGQEVFERFATGLADHLAPGGQVLLVLSSDGDGDQLLALLATAGFNVTPVARKNLINEVLTAYEVKA